LASSCQTIGQIIGIFISTSVYINVSYYKLIKLNTYFFILGLVFIIATVLLLFIDEEKDEDNDTLGLIETLKRVKQIFVNKNIRQFVGILLISQIGVIFFSKISILVMNEKGLSQELLTNISTCLIPIEVYVSYYLSKSNEKLLHNYLYGFCGLIGTAILDLILINSVEYIPRIYLIAILIILNSLKIWLSLMCFTGVSGFFYKICDSKIGATYITALNSVNNMASKWPGIFIFSLVDYFGYQSVGILSIIYSISFYLLFEKNLKKLDLLENDQWEIKNMTEVLDYSSDKEN